MCLHPVSLKLHRRVVSVPCGKCLQCVKTQQDGIVSRLSSEATCWPADKILFVRLSYRDDALPYVYTYVTSDGWLQSSRRLDFRETKRAKCPLYQYDYPYFVIPPEPLSFSHYFDLRKASSGSVVLTYQQTFEEAKRYMHENFGGYSNTQTGFLPQCPDFIDLDHEPTFADVCLAMPSLDKRDVQDFIKRLRISLKRGKAIDYKDYVSGSGEIVKCNSSFNPPEKTPYPANFVPRDIRVYYCGEYGSAFSRPHYHLLIFGIDASTLKKYIGNAWSDLYGNVNIQTYDPAKGGITYLSKYASKGCFDNYYTTKYYQYPNGKYFSSKFYEYSIRDFNLDAPLARPTFRSPCHGLGFNWLLSSLVLNMSDTVPTYAPNGSVSFSPKVVLGLPPDVKQAINPDSELLQVDFDSSLAKPYFGEPFSDSFRVSSEGSFLKVDFQKVHINYDTGEVISRFHSSASFDVNKLYSSYHAKKYLSLHYVRQYIKQDYDKTSGLYTKTAKRTEIGIPRYYLGYLKNPLFRLYRTFEIFGNSAPDISASDVVSYLGRFLTPSGTVRGSRPEKACNTNVDSSIEVKLQRSASNWYLPRLLHSDTKAKDLDFDF